MRIAACASCGKTDVLAASGLCATCTKLGLKPVPADPASVARPAPPPAPVRRRFGDAPVDGTPEPVRRRFDDAPLEDVAAPPVPVAIPGHPLGGLAVVVVGVVLVGFAFNAGVSGGCVLGALFGLILGGVKMMLPRKG